MAEKQTTFFSRLSVRYFPKSSPGLSGLVQRLPKMSSIFSQ
jgi:hypothetical protein